MIRPIMTLRIILARPSADAAPGDEPHAQDLLDTFAAHRAECVGMAANMIGVLKRIIVFAEGGAADSPARLMYNPRGPLRPRRAASRSRAPAPPRATAASPCGTKTRAGTSAPTASAATRQKSSSTRLITAKASSSSSVAHALRQPSKPVAQPALPKPIQSIRAPGHSSPSAHLCRREEPSHRTCDSIRSSSWSCLREPADLVRRVRREESSAPRTSRSRFKRSRCSRVLDPSRSA